MRILIVDDEPAIVEVMAAMLAQDGHFAETTTNGDEAFRIYCESLSKGQRFDFVLTGLAQPGMNGVELMEAIRKKNPAGQSFGFSTAHPVLLKPFDKSELLSFVKQNSKRKENSDMHRII
jgi:CheY-like chemotaxis protein